MFSVARDFSITPACLFQWGKQVQMQWQVDNTSPSSDSIAQCVVKEVSSTREILQSQAVNFSTYAHRLSTIEEKLDTLLLAVTSPLRPCEPVPSTSSRSIRPLLASRVSASAEASSSLSATGGSSSLVGGTHDVIEHTEKKRKVEVVNLTHPAYHLLRDYRQDMEATMSSAALLDESAHKKYFAFIKKATSLLSHEERKFIENKPSLSDVSYQAYQVRAGQIDASTLKKYFDSIWPQYNASLKRPSGAVSWESATIYQYSKAETYAKENKQVSGQQKLSFHGVSSGGGAGRTSSPPDT